MTIPQPSDPDAPPPSSPPTPDQLRPSDAERKMIASRLHSAVHEGRIDLSEYERRLRLSDNAPTMAELHTVVADLPASQPPPAEQTLLQIGDITVTQTSAYTPLGQIPLRGSQWLVQDRWVTEQKIPTWAIVLSIVGFFCLTIFSLLFLLARETRFHGTVDVTVTNARQQYVARIPVHSQQQVQHIYQQTNYVRSLAAQ